MEDKMKPGKPHKTVTTALKRAVAAGGTHNDPGRPSPSKPKGGGSNRGNGGVEGRK